MGRDMDQSKEQPVILLTWNPDRYNWSNYKTFLQACRVGKPAKETWSTGNNKSIQPGTRFYLLKQGGQGRGLIGEGEITSCVFQDNSWNDTGNKSANFAEASFEVLLDAGDEIPTDLLKNLVPDHDWVNIFASGNRVRPQAAQQIRQIWHSATTVLNNNSGEVVATSGLFEGSYQQVFVNAYERNSKARAKCIAWYGARCQICGFDFAKTYGELGEGFIHVHHIRDLSTIGATYQVDPIQDLVPVCPNCHAMLHREKPAMLPAKLKSLLSN